MINAVEVEVGEVKKKSIGRQFHLVQDKKGGFYKESMLYPAFDFIS